MIMKMLRCDQRALIAVAGGLMLNGVVGTVCIVPCMADEMRGQPDVESNTAQTNADQLQIDPLLIAEAEEVWKLCNQASNPLWPGWSVASTPLLFYLPGRQDVLINHPNPPDGFVPYTGSVEFAGGTIWVKDGPTIIEWDAQNTRYDVNGTTTLVVADTLSNRKNQMQGLLFDPTDPAEKFENLDYAFLTTNAYDQMATIAHEAFHVHQFHLAPDKGGNELDLVSYPTLSVANNTGWALEGIELAKALEETCPEARRIAARRWLAVRQDRRSHLSEAHIAYEDGTEFNEGLAKFIEWRLFHALEGSEHGPRMEYVQGFHGYGDLSPERSNLLTRMVDHMGGKINVNNDPYGCAPLRMRLYYSGMGIAALLDALSADGDWKGRITNPNVSLTSLLEDELLMTSGDSVALANAIRSEAQWQAIRVEKEELHEAGRTVFDGLVQQIDNAASGTLLIFDYSRLDSPEFGYSFTPFGIKPIDESKAIFSMAPFGAYMAGGRYFQQSTPLPTIHDWSNHEYRFRVTDTDIAASALSVWDKNGHATTQTVDLTNAQLAGVSINLGKVIVEQTENAIRFTFLSP